jgi:hypothetical protein
MKKLSVIFFMVMMIIRSFDLLAQNFDYHLEESPAISWNGVQMFDARMMALGGISLMASESFAAAAFKWGKTLDIGIKFDYIKGKRDVTVTDFEYRYFYEWIEQAYFAKTIILKQQENHKYTLLVPTVGVRLRLSSRWAVGTTWEIPLNQKTRSPKRFILAAESEYTLWSGYKYIFFDEEMPGDMKNTLVLGLGLEYGSYSSKGDFFLRLGFSLDPQPLKEPESSAFQQFALAHPPTGALTYHSYHHLILYPWAFTPEPDPLGTKSCPKLTRITANNYKRIIRVNSCNWWAKKRRKKCSFI